jgi:hypothetical protein
MEYQSLQIQKFQQQKRDWELFSQYSKNVVLSIPQFNTTVFIIAKQFKVFKTLGILETEVLEILCIQIHPKRVNPCFGKKKNDVQYSQTKNIQLGEVRTSSLQIRCRLTVAQYVDVHIQWSMWMYLAQPITHI